jgi:hypothetical protein
VANMDLTKWREVTGLFASLRGVNEGLIFSRQDANLFR